MEQVETVFREGVLSHLEQLETLAHNLAGRQEQGQQEEDVVLDRREAILQLRKERDELQAQIRHQKEEIQALTAGGEGSHPPQPSTREALQELRLEEMKGIMEGLWFTGISGKMTDHGVCFCLSPAFEVDYLGSYYIQVHNLKKPQITRHNVPPFIPLKEITASHLQSDLKKFLSVLFDHLNGFAGRKFQADQLQETGAEGPYIPDTLQRNSLHTVLSFNYNVTIDDQKFCFSAKLLYGAITAVLPTEALVTCPENAGPVQEAAASSHSLLFRSRPLHKALKSLTV